MTVNSQYHNDDQRCHVKRRWSERVVFVQYLWMSSSWCEANEEFSVKENTSSTRSTSGWMPRGSAKQKFLILRKKWTDVIFHFAHWIRDFPSRQFAISIPYCITKKWN